MIVAIAAVFMVECIKADDGYSVLTSVVSYSISPNSESIRWPFKIACYLFVLYERKPRKKTESLFKFANSLFPGTTSKNRFFPFEGSSTQYPVIIFLYFDSTSCGNIANFSPSFVQQSSFLYSSL